MSFPPPIGVEGRLRRYCHSRENGNLYKLFLIKYLDKDPSIPDSFSQSILFFMPYSISLFAFLYQWLILDYYVVQSKPNDEFHIFL